MKASQTETVIVLTCCALQSACYSPTGIVILFILSHFGAEVQTNFTFVRRFDDLKLPPLALGQYQRKKYF